ncbi:hypothetical protein D3C72_2089620 [compost metagenome]
MAAGMHHALIGACIIRPRLFVDRQGVDIGADAERACAVAIAQSGDDTGAGEPARHLITHFHQLPGNEVRGFELRKTDFRIAVQVAAYGHHIRHMVGKGCDIRGLFRHFQNPGFGRFFRRLSQRTYQHIYVF